MEPFHIEIPSLRRFARHALPNLIEGTLLPLAAFLLALRLVGVGGAMAAGLTVSYGAIAARLLTRRRVPGVLLLGALTLTARTALAVASGSVFVYFLQPTLGTAIVAAAFLLSVPFGRPLAQRLAHDFCPLPPDVFANGHVRRFFVQISLLWAFMQFANASVALWLLVSQSLTTFVVAKTLVSWLSTITAIALSTIWFHRSMRRNGIRVVRARVNG